MIVLGHMLIIKVDDFAIQDMLKMFLGLLMICTLLRIANTIVSMMKKVLGRIVDFLITYVWRLCSIILIGKYTFIFMLAMGLLHSCINIVSNGNGWRTHKEE